MDINQWLRDNFSSLREAVIPTTISNVDKLIDLKIERIRYRSIDPTTVSFVTEKGLRRYRISTILKTFNLLGLIGKKIKDVKLVSLQSSSGYRPKAEDSETGDSNYYGDKIRTISILTFVADDDSLSYIVLETSRIVFNLTPERTKTVILTEEIE